MATAKTKKLFDTYDGSKSSIAYKVAKDVINSTNSSYLIKNGLIRPAYISGSGRFIKLNDHTEAIKKILTLLSIKFTSGNDAPRGGKTGNFIKTK